MHAIAVIASVVDESGAPVLLLSDRAAVNWAGTLAGSEARVVCHGDDFTACTYARAVNATVGSRPDQPLDAWDIALVGLGAVQAHGEELAGEIAESAQAELLFDVLQVGRVKGGWSVVCNAGRGERDFISVTGPVVLVISPLATRPRYVSCHRLMRAGADQVQRQFNVMEVARVGAAWQPVKPRVTGLVRSSSTDAEARADAAFGISRANSNQSGIVLASDDPALGAQVLLRYLVHHNFISRDPSALAALRTKPDAASVSADVERPALTPPTDVTNRLSAAVRRGPRRLGESLVRPTRRPRPTADYSTGTARKEPGRRAPLRRGPRLLNSIAVPGSRGPFPRGIVPQSPTAKP